MPKNNIVPFPKAKSYVISVLLETGCYRHIQISANSTLEQLHAAILDAFSFNDDHLHAFFMSNRAWDCYDCYYSQYADEGPFTDAVTLTKIGLAVGKKFLYLFDFGEEWHFACRVLRQLEEATPEPFCVRTKGGSPTQYGDVDEGEEDDCAISGEQMLEQLMEMWKQFAVSAEKPAETLREMLTCRDKPELVNLLKEFGANKISRWSSDKLIEGSAGYLLKPVVLRDRICRFDRQQWAFFKEAAGQRVLQMEEIRPELCALPHVLGLLQPYRNRKGTYFCVVPQELRALLDTLLSEGLEAELERCWQLDEYATAVVNLYGIIPLAELVELFNNQSDQKVERSELLSTLEKRMTDSETTYCLWQNDNYLVHEALWEDDFAVAEDCLARTDGKPRYLPGREELLRYVDPGYYEQTPSMKAMGNYFSLQHGLDPEQLEDVLQELHVLAFLEGQPSEAMAMLADEYDILFDIRQMQKFTALLIDVMNNTRLWINKGHTPSEIYFTETGTPPLSPRVTVKVGRNESCPCGSGKKYKHCCGK